MATIIKRFCALSLCLSCVLVFIGCGERTPEQPVPVDIYRSTLTTWDTLTQGEKDEFLKLHSLHYQKYMERLAPLSDLIFAELLKSNQSDDLRLHAIADNFASAFLDSAWIANVPDAFVVNVRIAEHPHSALVTDGESAKYGELALEFTDTLENRYLLCFEGNNAVLYQDGKILESHYDYQGA